MYRGEWGLYNVLQISRLLTAQKAPRQTGLISLICSFPKCLFKNIPSASRMWDPDPWPTMPPPSRLPKQRGLCGHLRPSYHCSWAQDSKLDLWALPTLLSPHCPGHPTPASCLQPQEGEAGGTARPPLPPSQSRQHSSLPKAAGNLLLPLASVAQVKAGQGLPRASSQPRNALLGEEC